MQTLVTIILFAPLVAAIIAGLFGRRIGNVASQAITTGGLLLACGLSWYTFSQWTWGHMEAFTVHLLPFISIGDFQANWSIRIDALSAVMLIVVTTVSALVHIYSWGYMAEDDSKPRFFAYLSLFTFAMLSLVTAADFMQLYLRLGRRRPGLLPADRLLVQRSRRPAPPPARPSWSPASATTASPSAIATVPAVARSRFDPVSPEIFPQARRQCRADKPGTADRWSIWPACCCSVGAVGKSAQLLHCTPGCRTPWKARPRSRP